ncbi:MAG: hypothetical protein PF694_09305 [Bacteroidetes bacterium]|jgi:ssRNA-specific RNase YbeY (16S rRNA maturation enzyme)|nr:hypothetical protein [Bacteroidota bacterium]
MTKKMTVKKNEEQSTIKNSAPETAEDLRKKLLELQQKELEVAQKQIAELGDKLGVRIGLQLNPQKVTDIISFMINNNKPFITLQFEVWKESN